MSSVTVRRSIFCMRSMKGTSKRGRDHGTEQPAKAEYDAALVLFDNLDRRRQNHQDDEQDRHDDE